MLAASAGTVLLVLASPFLGALYVVTFPVVAAVTLSVMLFQALYDGCVKLYTEESHPRAVQLVMDSLRYWVTEMHVDGFRFDLASALARSFHDVNMLGNFMTTIQQKIVRARGATNRRDTSL